MSAPTLSKRSTTALGALAGVVAAIVALGVAELIAGVRQQWRSPVIDVGNRVIDNVPPFVKDFAIETFGTNDKPALLIGIGVTLLVYAAVIGALSFRRRIEIGLVGIGVFGLIGAWAAVSNRAGGSLDDAIPTLVGSAIGATTLWFVHRISLPLLAGPILAGSSSADAAIPSDPTNADQQSPTDAPRATRRELLVRSGGVLAALAFVGAGAGAVGRSIRSRFSAVESRMNVTLPRATNTLDPISNGVTVGVDGVAPFVTPNADFYRIDTALTVPQVPTEGYELRVTGMVDRDLALSFDDLLRRNVVEHDITLTCVSNTIGGELIGNARWTGVRLDELLAEAGVDPAATQVVGRSIDGYTCGFPIEAATDGRNALVAFGMNGEPLPLEHGFPVRLIVPGLYGYISATKWLTEIELTTFEDFEQYWVPRGYADRAPIKLMSRIDSVDGLGTLTRTPDGVAAIGGVAWAQTRGISAVEVQLDEGPWQPCELGDALNDDTWRQWAFRWAPTATGRTSIRCRATDGGGVIQPAERTEPLPNGASGHHQIVVFVE
ncbi:MAG TPA: molybdopterin-dependent oxidoreductase [Ilumatobacteraceae bacterium]|nr:molybdopterin-dependent oxidoreductase [Ilumatobacteraceae bacterium]